MHNFTNTIAATSRIKLNFLIIFQKNYLAWLWTLKTYLFQLVGKTNLLISFNSYFYVQQCIIYTIYLYIYICNIYNIYIYIYIYIKIYILYIYIHTYIYIYIYTPKIQRRHCQDKRWSRRGSSHTWFKALHQRIWRIIKQHRTLQAFQTWWNSK